MSNLSQAPESSNVSGDIPPTPPRSGASAQRISDDAAIAIFTQRLQENKAAAKESASAAGQCEAIVVGGVLARNERYWECAEIGLNRGHFADDLLGRLWKAMADLIECGQQANPITLAPRFAQDEALLAAGGMPRLAGLAMQSAGVLHLEQYAKLVRECAGRRLLFELGYWISEFAVDWEWQFPNLLAYIDEKVDQLRPLPTKAGIMPFGVAVDAALRAMERARERGEIDGAQYGLTALDRLVGGADKGSLVVLAGRPGMGKSALAAHVAMHNARQGKHVVLFSLEMSQEQIASRLLAQGVGISADQLLRGYTSHEQIQALLTAQQALEPLPIYIDEMAAIDPNEMRARLRRYRMMHKLDLLIVDYLQLMTTQPAIPNRVQEVSHITAFLKSLAKEFDVPVIALSQLSRAVELRDDKRPRLSDLRDSGSIEQDADAVIFIYREEYYLDGAEPKEEGSAHQEWEEKLERCTGQADLIVAKNRHGPCDTVAVGFDGKLTRFHDLRSPDRARR